MQRNANIMNPLDLINLAPLMKQTSGSPDLMIGFIDGPVLIKHPDLIGQNLVEINGESASCSEVSNTACMHGTYIAGVLSAKRGSVAPAICPSCTLLIRSIFFDSSSSGSRQMPNATPEELAKAIIECIDAGARVINMSLALAQPSINQEKVLTEVINYAVMRNVIVIAAAGNQNTLGSSPITRHPWVIPVVAIDENGRPVNGTNLGNSIGRRGFSAPGNKITSLGIAGQAITSGGTSVAVPFVTGTVALLWSLFPTANAIQIKQALLASIPRQASVVPPLMNAGSAYQYLKTSHFQR